jgi:hypothetical protein
VEGLACVAAARGDGRSAATLVTAAGRWRFEARRPASPLEMYDIQRATDRARALLGPDAYERVQATVPTEPHDLLVPLPAPAQPG